MKKIISFAGMILLTAVSAQAQIAQGGTYKLEQSIVAGGSTSAEATGSVYKLDGVIGEPVAGTTSTGTTFAIKGGFLNSSTLAPTAASVSISGRVLAANGGGLMNARVSLTDSNGNARTVLTKKLGAFRFDDVEAGAVYIITVGSRRYTFTPQIISVTENLTDINFTAQEAVVLQ